MRPGEAAEVLHFLLAAFPSQELEEQTMRLWIDVLGHVEVADARVAASALIADREFFPSLAALRKYVATAQRARENRDAARRGLPGPSPARPDRFRESVEGVWDALAERGTRKHWHGGPDPCPVCPPLRCCPSCGTTHDPSPASHGHKAQVIDLQQRLAERRRRLDVREVIP